MQHNDTFCKKKKRSGTLRSTESVHELAENLTNLKIGKKPLRPAVLCLLIIISLLYYFTKDRQLTLGSRCTQ